MHNNDGIRDLVAERIERTKGKISGQTVRTVVRTAGYE